MAIQKWKKLSQKEFKGSYKTFLTKEFELPNGSKHSFDIWYLKNGFIGVFALTKDLEVITATSYRPGPEMILQEMPFGIVDDGETTKQAAIRELLEETGYQPTKTIMLGENIAWMPYADGMGNYFLALDCKLVSKQKLDDAEDINVELIPLKTYVKEVLRKGKTSHSECGWLAIDYLLQNKIINLDDIS